MVGGCMKQVLIKFILFLPVLFLLNISVARSQDVATIWIRVSDDVAIGDTATLYMVNSPNGTYQRDSLNPCYQEIGNPPCLCFNASWSAWATYTNDFLGFNGGRFIPFCIEGIPTNPTVKDTFKLTGSEGGGFSDDTENFLLQWPSQSYLAARCDSMFLVDETNLLTDSLGNHIGTINMFNQNRLFIYQPEQALLNSEFSLYIYKYGVHLVDSLDNNCIIEAVHEPPKTIPTSFRLEQNYPNPFNPTTKFNFSIAQRGFVTLKVYDVLGRTVATLVEEEKNPGRYVVPWNADNIGSGVYFYTLRSGIEHDVKKLAILR